MIVVPLELRNFVIDAGLEDGYQGVSLFHFVPGVDVADFPELAAEMVAVPPSGLPNPVIAVVVGVEEGRRKVSTRPFADARAVANNVPVRTAATIVVPAEYLSCREKQDAKHQRQSTRGLVVPDVAVLS